MCSIFRTKAYVMVYFIFRIHHTMSCHNYSIFRTKAMSWCILFLEYIMMYSIFRTHTFNIHVMMYFIFRTKSLHNNCVIFIDQWNLQFVHFLLDNIEEPPHTDTDDEIPDIFINMLLSFNQHFECEDGWMDGGID